MPRNVSSEITKILLFLRFQCIHNLLITTTIEKSKEQERDQTFNNLFAKLCMLVDNTSKLPINYFKRANSLLSTTLFTKYDIAQIIKNLNRNKAHNYDQSGLLSNFRDWFLIFQGLIFPWHFPSILVILNPNFPVNH